MTMAIFLRGKPIVQDYTPSSAYSAGDVLVVGSTPMIAHEDNPYDGTTTNLVKDALAVSGGIYQIPADAAYSNGTQVWWDTVKKQVTADVTSTSYHFGVIVAGPTDQASDAGPTGAASLASVLHAPLGLQTLGQSGSLLANPRNLIDGGDFGTNPAQRGTSQAADITSTTTYGPDRFAFKGAAGSAINWSIVADTSVVGFAKSLKFQRKSANADTTAINMVQVLESSDCTRCQGQTVTISFWAKKGANYSGGALTIQVETSTGNDQSAANLIAGSWTGQAHVVNTTQVLTTSMVRYQFTGSVPSTCTQLGVIFQWTPTGTAGADDSISFNGIQLEIGNGATPYEHRDVEVELALCQRYFFQLNEPASGNIVAAGHNSATNTQIFALGLPTPMRAAPTVTVTVGSFKANSSTAGIVAATGLTASGTHTTTQVGLTSTGTGTAGQGATLQGGGGAGLIAVSADY